jgi:hypothetical protein
VLALLLLGESPSRGTVLGIAAASLHAMKFDQDNLLLANRPSENGAFSNPEIDLEQPAPQEFA